MVSSRCQAKAGQSTEGDGSRNLFLVMSYYKLLTIFYGCARLDAVRNMGTFPYYEVWG